jgi:hypothetical protein
MSAAWNDLKQRCSCPGFSGAGAQENQHGPPPLQPGVNYINPGEEDQMVSHLSEFFMFESEVGDICNQTSDILIENLEKEREIIPKV